MELRNISKTQRNLPHWHSEGVTYWVTFRLADSIPQRLLQPWQRERKQWLQSNPKPWTEEQRRFYEIHFLQKIDQWLDAGRGACFLARPDLRQLFVELLMKFEGVRHRLYGAVVMPNHVHLLIEPWGADGILSKLLKGIKGASARAINQDLGRSGTLWMEESFDHIVRSREQLQRLLKYIECNPVAAGLSPEDYWLYLPEIR